MNTEKTQVTCVSGYWNVKNKHDNKYISWMKKSLRINCPYVFFTNEENLEMIKECRNGLPTHYIICSIEEFHTYKYKSRMIEHERHCPSIELNLIWNEKIFLMNKALQLNPFMSDFFIWVDAGICVYRDNLPPKLPFPNLNKMNSLPKNKFIYSASDIYNESNVNPTNYYHSISGTVYILHRDIIEYFANIYDQYLNKLVDENNIWTDQVILTHIYKDHRDLFHHLCNGYGMQVPNLY